MWMRYEQSIISKEEEKFKKLTASLNLFYDNEQLVRLNTRLLRQDSHFSKRRSHEQMFYSGLESILSNVRLYFWIIRGRSFVKNILKNCYLCKLGLAWSYNTKQE